MTGACSLIFSYNCSSIRCAVCSFRFGAQQPTGEPVEGSLEANMLGTKILAQVEFYFSDQNYPTDKFLQKTANEHTGWVIHLRHVLSLGALNHESIFFQLFIRSQFALFCDFAKFNIYQKTLNFSQSVCKNLWFFRSTRKKPWCAEKKMRSLFLLPPLLKNSPCATCPAPEPTSIAILYLGLIWHKAPF